MALSEADANAITSTWSLVSPDLKGNGVAFFIHFFTNYPEYQKKFRGFAEIPLDQLKDNKRLKAHGFTVLSSIDGLVNNMDDPDVLSELLFKIGQNHSKRQLKVGDFQILNEVILDFFSKALGEAWTPEAHSAWKKLLAVMVEKIKDGLTSAD